MRVSHMTSHPLLCRTETVCYNLISFIEIKGVFVSGKPLV